MAAKDDLGRAGEDRAALYLTDLGYRILARNWRCELGELDIVAEWRDVLVFVEVKTRRSLLFGHPFEAIDERKRRRMWRLAHAWVREHPLSARGRPLRLEAIGIVGSEPSCGILEHLTDLR
ncbi:YraN family protein [Microbacterium resistens]|uniref:YraN family protein n=1 Tax=Microbacterium resistens TaxID=156977 RepID=UPI00082DAF1C|nr:YraN family protein [Microbacterium resistens]